MALTETEEEKLRLYVLNELKDNADLFDIDAEMDRTLTLEENKTIIADKISMMVEKGVDRDTADEYRMLQNLNNAVKGDDTPNFFPKIADKVNVMVVFGGTGSGKTALTYKFLHGFKRPVYIYEHPKPHLIKVLGYQNIDMSKLSRLTDSVVWFDEPQLYFEKTDKRSNEIFLKLCSLARQNDLTLIFSTSDTRWVNRGLESYVSHWAIKNLDMTLVKQGSAIKKIIKKVMPLVSDNLNLGVDEYIFYSNTDKEKNGLHTFKKPLYFNEELSKAWKHQKPEDNCEETATKVRQEPLRLGYDDVIEVKNATNTIR